MTAKDTFDLGGDLTIPAPRGFPITKSDVDELPFVTRGIYVGGTGDVVIVTAFDEELTFTAVPTGTILPIRAKFVKAATTATNLVGLF